MNRLTGSDLRFLGLLGLSWRRRVFVRIEKPGYAGPQTDQTSATAAVTEASEEVAAADDPAGSGDPAADGGPLPLSA